MWPTIMFDPKGMSEEMEMGERKKDAKFQSVWFGNAFAVPELPQMGHRSPS